MYVYKPRRGMKRSEDSKVRNAQLRKNMIAHTFTCHFCLIEVYFSVLNKIYNAHFKFL